MNVAKWSFRGWAFRPFSWIQGAFAGPGSIPQYVTVNTGGSASLTFATSASADIAVRTGGAASLKVKERHG